MQSSIRTASSETTGEPPEAASKIARRWVILTILLFASGYFAYRPFVVADPDIYWRIQSGNWIVQHHAFPHADPFSISKPGWVAYSWFFDLVSSLFFNAWNLRGVLLFTAILTVIVAYQLWSLIYELRPDFVRATSITALCLFSMGPVFMPRPWMCSIALFTFQLRLLFKYRRNPDYRILLLLPPLYAVMGNVHVQFVHSLIVLSLAAFTASIPDHWKDRSLASFRSFSGARALWLVVAGCCLATLINPYGWHLYQVIARYANGQMELARLQEMQPMSFRSPLEYVVLALVLAAGYALGKCRSRDFFLWSLLIFSCYFAFRTQRDLWLAVISSAAIIASNSESPLPAERRLTRGAALAALLAGTVLVLVFPKQGVDSLDQYQASIYPVKAVGYVKENHLQGPLFNHFNWGGFLILYLPEQPVSIDGRTNVHGPQATERSLNTWNLTEGWQSDPQLKAANLIIGSPQHALSQHLLTDPAFRLAYHDDVAYVFVRR